MSCLHLQRIAGCRVCNRLPFGRRLRRLACSLLPGFLEETKFGFQDGGCLMFAEALRAWSRGSLALAAVYRTDRAPAKAQHVLAQFGADLYLDSDGAGTAADMTAKMAAFNSLRCTQVRPYVRLAGDAIPHDSNLVAMLARRMQRRFGDFDPAMFLPFTPEV